MRFPDEYLDEDWRFRDRVPIPVPQPEEGTWSTNPPDVPIPLPGTGVPPEDPLEFPPWVMPTYSGGMRPNIQIGPAPKFSGPRFSAPQFRQPSMQDALNEPGYQFRVGQGTDALERSAAARGVLRTGGTLKDLIEYGQNFAAEEYKQVFNRALQGYGADYRAAFDEHAADYRAAYDEYAPSFAQWQLQSGANQAGALAEFERLWAQHVLNVENSWREDQRLRELALPTPQPTPQDDQWHIQR